MTKHWLVALLAVLFLTKAGICGTSGENQLGSCRIVCDPSTDRSTDRSNGLVIPLASSGVGPPGPAGPPGKTGPPGLPGPMGKSGITNGGVAFYASMKDEFENNAVLKFTDVITNLGGGYDSSTGTFTCKTPGAYYFIFHIVKSGQSLRVDLVLNDQLVVATAIAVDVLHTDTASNSAVVQLKDGDRVYVRLNNSILSKKQLADRLSTFSGYLV
ncbi:complement C1q-like protein 3 [Triplophysa dalaica]|uniref:complement C1q-like protein 3 n=1 Tax=Triplophysa dalaica TaxID=1582913 RepID=UPI0024DFDFD5|nr:complement C1q-like protein 3 [Triplophysa dalaica]